MSEVHDRDPLGDLQIACVETLFTWNPTDAFTALPGHSLFSARWTDTSTFVLTTDLDVTGSTYTGGTSVQYGAQNANQLRVGTTPFIQNSGLTANGTQICGDDPLAPTFECLPSLVALPNPLPPSLVNFTVDDDDNSVPSPPASARAVSPPVCQAA